MVCFSFVIERECVKRGAAGDHLLSLTTQYTTKIILVRPTITAHLTSPLFQS